MDDDAVVLSLWLSTLNHSCLLTPSVPALNTARGSLMNHSVDEWALLVIGALVMDDWAIVGFFLSTKLKKKKIEER